MPLRDRCSRYENENEQRRISVVENDDDENNKNDVAFDRNHETSFALVRLLNWSFLKGNDSLLTINITRFI